MEHASAWNRSALGLAVLLDSVSFLTSIDRQWSVYERWSLVQQVLRGVALRQ